MSKVGKKPIVVPEGVTLQKDTERGREILRVKGLKGEVVVPVLAHLAFDQTDKEITVSTTKNMKQARANWGTMASLLRNAIQGVTEGFERTLVFEGVGYRGSMQGAALELNVGYSHPVLYTPPEGVTLAIEKNKITVSGIDKIRVGQVAAEIRKIRKPEPYKGTGIRYEGEVIRRKAGKKAVGSGA